MDDFGTDLQGCTIRRAERADVPAIVALLRDDPIGAARETGDAATYESAFDEVDADPQHFLAVVCAADESVVGTMQLTLVPGLSRAGATRLLVEGVRVGTGLRGSGLGTAMMTWAHEYARRRGAVLAELTSNRSRVDAHRFYERLGYTASHVGLKLPLDR